MSGNFVVLDTITNNTSRTPILDTPALAGTRIDGVRDVLFGF